VIPARPYNGREIASNFYAQHPTLVKAIGAGALALLMSKISAARSQQ